MQCQYIEVITKKKKKMVKQPIQQLQMTILTNNQAYFNMNDKPNMSIYGKLEYLG